MKLLGALFIIIFVSTLLSSLQGRDQSQYSLNKYNVASEPALTTTDQGKTYIVTEAWYLRVKGNTFCIPAGFSSNGITAKPCIRDFLGNGIDEPETQASMFHDWLIVAHKKGHLPARWTRKMVDDHFLQLLLDYGVDRHKARLMYKAVRLFSIKTAPIRIANQGRA